MIATRPLGSVFVLPAIVLGLFLEAASAQAQYLYLDSNGDGVHTAADVVQPSGVTQVDVWLRTDRNRDGSAATCVTQDGSLTINSYTFILHASNGTVSWGTITNRIPEFDIPYSIMFQGSDYHAGYASGTILPAGDYRLATVPVTATSGTPAIGIASSTPLGPTLITSFGSQCFGNDQDNTLKLGLDWTDTDGLVYGGVPNNAPVLDQPADMSVTEGETADQPLSGTDPDGQPLSFFRAGGPGFVEVTTTNPGVGHAAGAIHLAPDLFQGGGYTVAIGASDGIASDQKTIHVDVLEGQGITFSPIAPMTVESYSRASQVALAQDIEGRAVVVSKSTGPDYMRVVDQGLNRGEITLEPGLYDAGTTTGSVVGRNGSTELVQSFPITVSPLPACGPGWCTASRDFMKPVLTEHPLAVGAADLNGDSHPDLIANSDNDRRIMIHFGRGNGTFESARVVEGRPSLGNPWQFCFGDLNGDGRLDMVATLGEPPFVDQMNLVPYFNQGDGTLVQGTPIAHGSYRERPAVGDLNGDNRLDIAVGDGRTGYVSVFFQNADGTFAAPLNLIGAPNGVVVADFNGDTHPDLASLSGASLHMYLGRGDGTFQPDRISSVQTYGRGLVSADFNRDGRPDLATVGQTSLPGVAEVFLNAGGGTMTAMPPLRVAGYGTSIGCADWNKDGSPDLIVAGFETNPTGFITVFLGDGDGTFSSRQDFPTAGKWGFYDLITADWNGDGFGDVALANWYELPAFLSRGYTPLPNRPPTILAPLSVSVDQGGHYYFNVAIDDLDTDDPLGNLGVDRSLVPSGVIVEIYFAQSAEGRYYLHTYVDRPLPPAAYPIVFSISGTSIKATTDLVVSGEPQLLAGEVLLSGSSRTITLADGKSTPVTVAIEPVGGSFRSVDILPYTVVMHGETLLPEIFATAKAVVLTDRDRDGVQELEVSFARADVARLFGAIHGRREVHGALEGKLATGRWFRAPCTLTLVGAPPTALAASIAPNPLNPDAVLSFDLPREGRVDIELFDLAGRHVRTILDGTALPAGTHQVRIDGRGESGAPLASGVYFYRINTVAGHRSGRFAIIK